MKTTAAVILLSGALFACAPAPSAPVSPPPAPAPPAPAPAAETAVPHRIVTIRAVDCDTLLRLAEDDRAAASLFYIGYTAHRRNRATIDVADLSGFEAAALGYCAAHPAWPAALAFNKAFADNGR